MSQFYDKTKITFHRGNAFSPEGVDKAPFATFIINDLITQELIQALCSLMREHVNETHMDCCNIKLNTEDWDC